MLQYYLLPKKSLGNHDTGLTDSNKKINYSRNYMHKLNVCLEKLIDTFQNLTEDVTFFK